MANRKLPDSYEEKPFIDGFHRTRQEDGDLPEYGYQGNHIPTTSGKIRKTESSFTIAQKRSGTTR